MSLAIFFEHVGTELSFEQGQHICCHRRKLYGLPPEALMQMTHALMQTYNSVQQHAPPASQILQKFSVTTTKRQGVDVGLHIQPRAHH